MAREGDFSEGKTDEGSEYGGLDGLVQLPPHEPTPSELRALLTRSAPVSQAHDVGSGSEFAAEFGAAGPGAGVQPL